MQHVAFFIDPIDLLLQVEGIRGRCAVKDMDRGDMTGFDRLDCCKI